jgi:hypothetical protein
MKMVCSPDSTGAEINPHLYLILRELKGLSYEIDFENVDEN